MFYGSLVALITPMLANGDIDYTALEALIDWHIASGTDGLVVLGTTGEAASMSASERRLVIETTLSRVRGSIPVIVGTGMQGTRATIALTQEAQQLGADGALLVTPSYVKPTQRGLYQHFQAIAQACTIPQILYNVPSRTACDLLPETVLQLSHEKHIVGIKDATADLTRLKAMLSAKDNLVFLSGDDATAKEFMLQGGSGVISVVANVAPDVMKRLCDNARSGDQVQANETDAVLAPLCQVLGIESNPIPVKFMLHQMRRISKSLRLPLTELDDKFQPTCLAAMRQFGLI